MLTIGRALMTNPDVLILDEATEGLAPLMRQEIWGVIRRLREQGLATVIVDKNIVTLLDLADWAVILVKGHVVFLRHRQRLEVASGLLSTHLGI